MGLLAAGRNSSIAFVLARKKPKIKASRRN